MTLTTPAKANRKKALALIALNETSATPVSVAPTKQSLLIHFLEREAGASIPEVAAAFGWQLHTTRAALTGLRKKGHAIAKAKVGGETRYSLDRVVPA